MLIKNNAIANAMNKKQHYILLGTNADIRDISLEELIAKEKVYAVRFSLTEKNDDKLKGEVAIDALFRVENSLNG